MRTSVRMRWENLTVESERDATLPGFKEPAVVRTFDAPEALGIRFYEVRARSAINEVPKRSRMPFRYTINPYRGCSHACVYCFARPTHTYLDFNAREDFERQIVVKVNVPELVRSELARRVVEGRARGAGHQHGPLPVGRGPLRADAGDLGGDARLLESLLGADQVAAPSPRPGADARDRRAHRVHRQPLHPDPRREGLASDRAAHPAPAEADRGGRGAEARRDSHRRPDRAADPGRERLAGPGRAPARPRGGGRRRLDRRRGPSPARRGSRHLVRLAARAPPRSPAALRGAVRARRVHAQDRRPSASSAMVRRGRRGGPSRGFRQRPRPPAEADLSPPPGRQPRLF